MKTYNELKVGDIVYECDFDIDESGAIPFNEVKDTIDTYVVVHHSIPHHRGNLYLVPLERNSWTRPCEIGNAQSPVAMLRVPNDEVCTTKAEAVRREAAWRACYGQAHVRDAAVLRDWADINSTQGEQP